VGEPAGHRPRISGKGRGWGGKNKRPEEVKNCAMPGRKGATKIRDERKKTKVPGSSKTDSCKKGHFGGGRRTRWHAAFRDKGKRSREADGREEHEGEKVRRARRGGETRGGESVSPAVNMEHMKSSTAYSKRSEKEL